MKALVIDRHSSLFLLQPTQAVFKPSPIFVSKTEPTHLSKPPPDPKPPVQFTIIKLAQKRAKYKQAP